MCWRSVPPTDATGDGDDTPNHAELAGGNAAYTDWPEGWQWRGDEHLECVGTECTPAVDVHVCQADDNIWHLPSVVLDHCALTAPTWYPPVRSSATILISVAEKRRRTLVDKAASKGELLTPLVDLPTELAHQSKSLPAALHRVDGYPGVLVDLPT